MVFLLCLPIHDVFSGDFTSVYPNQKKATLINTLPMLEYNQGSIIPKCTGKKPIMKSHAARAGNRFALSMENPKRMKPIAPMMLVTIIATDVTVAPANNDLNTSSPSSGNT